VHHGGSEDPVAAGDDPVGELGVEHGAAVGVAQDELVEARQQECPLCLRPAGRQEVGRGRVEEVLDTVDVEAGQPVADGGQSGPGLGDPKAGPAGEVLDRRGPVAAEEAPGELGERTTLAEARARVGFRPLLPRVGALGALRAVFAEGERVTLRYDGALLSEFPGRTRSEFVGKTAGPRTRVEAVTVAGGRGFWISGAPHVLLFEDPAGEIRESPPRLAGNTLVWRRGRLTLRLEADVDRERALAIARSIR